LPRENGYRRKPNLTLHEFCKWVETEHHITISESTADVVEHRKE